MSNTSDVVSDSVGANLTPLPINLSAAFQVPSIMGYWYNSTFCDLFKFLFYRNQRNLKGAGILVEYYFWPSEYIV